MNRKSIVWVALVCFSSSCRSSSKVTEAPPPSVDWGTDDIESVSKGVVEGLLDLPELSFLTSTSRGDDLRVPAFMAGISNETQVGIDSAALVEALERLLIGSGRFRFVTPGLNEDLPAQGPRKTSKMTAARAREAGYELGAEVAIFAVFRTLKGSQRTDGEPGYALELSCLGTEDDDAAWTTTREVSRTGVDFFRVR